VVILEFSMSVAAREAFLAAVHVGIIGVDDPRGESAPLLVPVWYRYSPGGDIVVETRRESLKARLLRGAGRFSLCVQDETAPYRYVSVEGAITEIADPIPAEERRNLAFRYLDPGTAEAYLKANEIQLAEDILIRMRPQRWRTADFSAFAADFSS
jgi:nitroimidazol reductase NimA-like FMN-containing flavoprotein (pyridoxamine 5'-phosphate oxidase superfamily)